MHFKQQQLEIVLGPCLSGRKHFPHPYGSENFKYLLLPHKCYIFKCVFTAEVPAENSTVGTEILTHVFYIRLLLTGCSSHADMFVSL